MPSRLHLLIALGITWTVFGCSADSPPPSVPLWGRWEHAFIATTEASQETVLHVQLTAPSGAVRRVEGFWDGDRTWRVRFMPDEAGEWHFQTSSSPAADGLQDQRGRFTCFADTSGGHRFLRHGPIAVDSSSTHLSHRDGTPFFWLGDTAWNGALRSSVNDWDAYLADRTAKGFSVIQFVTTPWRAALTNAEGETAFSTGDTLRIHPSFFQRIDRRIDAVNAAGLLAAPVLLWALGDPDEYPVPGRLPEDQAVRLARYLVARYGAHHVVWILGGDGDYGGAHAARWQRIGRAVFDGQPHAPATLHPQGMQWPWEAFADEPWLDFLMYQSGHGDSPETLRWLQSGPPSTFGRADPSRPVLNAEPPYEDHVAYQSRRPHTAYSVRRAVYWSLLNAPITGVTYGAHGIWSWETEPGIPLNHDGSGRARPWREAAALPGSHQMGYAADLLTALPWWTLRPDPGLLHSQPGVDDPTQFVAASRSAGGDLAVLYLPVGGEIRLASGILKPGLQATWMNPRDGTRRPGGGVTASPFIAPDGEDWVLVLHEPGIL